MPPPPAPEASRAIAEKIAEEIGCRPQQVLATASLLDEGATVPFVARYRKEVTGGLDDIQLRLLDERLTYLRELEERRSAVLASANRPAQREQKKSDRSESQTPLPVYVIPPENQINPFKS